MLGYQISPPHQLHLYKLTFGLTSPDFALNLGWQVAPWSASYSDSLLISSSIYSIFSYGNISNRNLYLVVISLPDGSVNSSRYYTISALKQNNYRENI